MNKILFIIGIMLVMAANSVGAQTTEITTIDSGRVITPPDWQIPGIIPPTPATNGVIITTDKITYHTEDQINITIKNNNNYKININNVDMTKAATGDVVDSYQCLIPEGCGSYSLPPFQSMKMTWNNLGSIGQGGYKIQVQWWREYDCYPACLMPTVLQTSYSRIFMIK